MTGTIYTEPLEDSVVATGVCKAFTGPDGQPVQALNAVSLRVRRGQMTALVGPDGAGKTTLMRMMAGLMVPDAGQLQVLGVDVARFGADRSVVYLGVNGVVRFVDSWAKTDLVHSAQRVHDLALREGAHAVAIDCDGIGGGMFDILNSYANRTYDILAVRGSMSSPDRGRWHNYRSYMWDSFRYRCRTGELDLDPLDIDLHDELLSVGYSYNTMSGGLVLDSKDKLKKDVGKSPDLADAAVYAAITDQNIRDAIQQETVFSDAGDMMDGDEDDYLHEMGETFGFQRILV